jgi:hypothetical protein
MAPVDFGTNDFIAQSRSAPRDSLSGLPELAGDQFKPAADADRVNECTSKTQITRPRLPMLDSQTAPTSASIGGVFHAGFSPRVAGLLTLLTQADGEKPRIASALNPFENHSIFPFC